MKEEEEKKEKITKENPFTRRNRNSNLKNNSDKGAPKEEVKKSKRMVELIRRDPAEARASIYRQLNIIKLQATPFLKSLLCFDFFARLVIFIGLAKLFQY